MDTLICIFLRGGADTLNMVVPYADDDYYRMRPTIAIAKPGTQTNNKACIKLNDTYAFHPSMKALVPSFRDGRLAIVQGIGTDNVSGSHFEAQDQIEHGESAKRTVGGGWLGRYLKTLKEPMSPLSAVAIGSSVPESLRGAPSVSAFRTIDDIRLKAPPKAYDDIHRTLAALYEAEPDMVASAGRDTLQLMSRVQQLQHQKYKPAKGVAYPDTEFASGLREIARLIKADVGLRVASIDLGGWDTHFVQGGNEGLQADLITQFSDALAAFDADVKTVPKETGHNIHTLVLTEFGRRTYENSSLGTDHGRGFAAFVLSNKIRGGRIIGEYAGLKEEPSQFLLGPSGLTIKHDYLTLLSETLSGLMGSNCCHQIFPDMQSASVGLLS